MAANQTSSMLKVNQISKDLNIKSKDLADIFAKEGIEYKAQKSLEPREFDILFDKLTRENQINGIEDYLDGITYIPSKSKTEEPKKEKAEPEKKAEPAKVENKPEEKVAATPAPVAKEEKPAPKAEPAPVAAPEEKKGGFFSFFRGKKYSAQVPVAQHFAPNRKG